VSPPRQPPGRRALRAKGRPLPACALVLCAFAGCHGSQPVTPPDLAPAIDPLVAARPYSVTLPAGHDASVPSPLIVVLHGYTATGELQDAYLGISAHADAHGTIVARPDGLVDALGNHYWNADDACCDVFASGVDDVAYLTAVIDDATLRYGADPKRVFLVGHSNGAFMAHRLACDRADRVAGIAALAGEVWKDTSKCQPSAHVAVAQIHGDADDTVLYGGGPHVGGVSVPSLMPYPGSEATFQFWSAAGGCTGTSDGGALDLDAGLPGAETTVTRATGCGPGAAAELWRIAGGGHVPNVTQSFAESVYGFFAAHGR
jgi:polyhydroxybutyrate depolymerase